MDAYEETLTRSAEEILCAANEMGPLFSSRLISRTEEGLEVVILVRPLTPTRQPIPLLSEIETAVVAILAEYGCPVPGPWLLDQLEKRGHITSLSTLKRVLTRLKELGVVLCSRTSPRGYFLSPEWTEEIRDLLNPG